MLQNIIVIQRRSGYQALTDLSHELVAESADAGTVIQSAIDALAVGGGQITIGRGMFPITQPLRLADRIWLRGSGRATRLVAATLNTSGIGILCENIVGATISDLSIQPEQRGSGMAGLVFDACGDCVARELLCIGFGSYGICLRNSSALCSVEHCGLVGNQQANLYLDELRAGQYGNYIPNRTTNCTIYGGGNGIECHRAIAVTINGCMIHQAQGAAIHIHTKSHAAMVSGSRTYQTTGDAVVVEHSHEFNMTGNTICWQTGQGVVVHSSDWGTISGNQIVDSGSHNPARPTRLGELSRSSVPGDGIRLLQTSGYQISGNAIFNWGVVPPLGYGISEDEGCFKNNITNNTINYVQSAAVSSAGQGSIVSNNQEHIDLPYNDHRTNTHIATDERLMQYFEQELTERFITRQLAYEAPDDMD